MEEKLYKLKYETFPKLYDVYQRGPKLSLNGIEVAENLYDYLIVKFYVDMIESSETNFVISSSTFDRACSILSRMHNLLTSEYIHVTGSHYILHDNKLLIDKHLFILDGSDIDAYRNLHGYSFGGWITTGVQLLDENFINEVMCRTVQANKPVYCISK